MAAPSPARVRWTAVVVLTVAVLVAVVAVVAGRPGGGHGHSRYQAPAMAYGAPVSQPSFRRLVAAVRKETGSTRVLSLTGHVDGYGAYEVVVPAAGSGSPRELRFHYTYGTIERSSSGPAYVAGGATPFDLTTLDPAVLERIHRAAWDAADRRVADSALTVTAPADPKGPWVRVVVTGTDDSAYHLDAALDGTVVDQGSGTGS